MNHILTLGLWHDLALADGSCWEIAAGDMQSESIVSQLGCAMQLHRSINASEASIYSNPYQLLVQVDAHTFATDCDPPLASENHGVVVCVLSPSNRWGRRYINLMRLSLIFAREAQVRGGMLIHGALAERDGVGVILAAPGGTGKTTASKRLPSPWHSLSDDTTLVVCDPQGKYWAHPWPTWSRFLDGGIGGAWDVKNAVPIKGIFFLVQAVADRVERVDTKRAISLLLESVKQASMFMEAERCKEELYSLHLKRFDNLCALAQVLPAHLLHISLTGAFWLEIEQALGV